MSNLEKYILDNRDELDRVEAVPEEAMWQKIYAKNVWQKPPTQLRFNWRILCIAAFVLALAGWGLLFFKKADTTPVQPSAPPMPKVGVPIAEQATEVAPAEAEIAALPPQPQQQAPIAKQPHKKPKRANTQTTQPEVTPSTASSEEQRLQQLVAQKQREIGLDTLDRTAYAELLQELDELEVTVKEARADFDGMPGNERLLHTLIKYYELKIRILEQISNEINKREYHEALEKRI